MLSITRQPACRSALRSASNLAVLTPAVRSDARHDHNLWQGQVPVCAPVALSSSRNISARATKATPTAAPKVSQAAAGEVDQSLDIGNIIHLEHVNIEVADLEVARLFFAEGLGLTVDNTRTGAERGGHNVVWYNIGRQQFHVAKGPESQAIPQNGAFFLVMPNVAHIAEQLEHVATLLGDVSVSHISPTMIEVTDPYGNHYVVQESAEGFPFRMGISNILLPCFQGTSKAIAAFYSDCLGAAVRTPSSSRAEVIVGAGTKLSFVENHSLGQINDEAVKKLHSGWHVAIYIANFSGTFHKLMPQPVNFNDHPYRDKCHSFADAIENNQFRFQEVRADAGKGALLYRLSHEVRSLHHPQCFKPLFNRS